MNTHAHPPHPASGTASPAGFSVAGMPAAQPFITPLPALCLPLLLASGCRTWRLW